MNRAFLLSSLAALASGCYNHPCYTPYLNVYWRPGPPPNAGFVVPGLVAAGFPAELDCAEAGVATVKFFVNGVHDSTWPCTTGGVSIALGSGGTYDVQIDGYDASGNNLMYTSGPIAIRASGCGDTSVGIFPDGVDGTLGIDYAFVPPANCQPGSQIVWDLRSGTSAAFDTGAVTCGTTNPFLVFGGGAVPAGVYTLVDVAEVVGSSPAFHVACSSTPFVHAGPETLLVDMPAPTATCF
jgi:hypothetical protein